MKYKYYAVQLKDGSLYGFEVNRVPYLLEFKSYADIYASLKGGKVVNVELIITPRGAPTAQTKKGTKMAVAKKAVKVVKKVAPKKVAKAVVTKKSAKGKC